jgi:hypothetical protein
VDLSCQLLLHAAAPFALDENLVSAVNSSSSGVLSGASNASLKDKFLQVEKFSQDTASFQVLQNGVLLEFNGVVDFFSVFLVLEVGDGGLLPVDK